MIYPKKRIYKMASGAEIPYGAIASTASGILDQFGSTNDLKVHGQSVGIEAPKVGMAAAKGALSGAASGAAFGPAGMLIGGAIGGVTSLIGAAKQKRLAEEQQKKTSSLMTRQNNEQAANIYGRKMLQNQQNLTGYGKQGMKVCPPNKQRMYAAGGVITSGLSHSEGGNPIIDSATGEKTAESESKELIFSLPVTQSIESHIANYDKGGDVASLLEIGRIVSSTVLGNTIDHSGQVLK